MAGGKRKVRRHVKLANADKDALTRAREHLTSLWIMTTGYVAKDFMYCPNTTSDGGNDATTPPDANPANPTSQNDAPCTTTTPGLPLAHMRLVHESGLMEEYALILCVVFRRSWMRRGRGRGFVKGVWTGGRGRGKGRGKRRGRIWGFGLGWVRWKMEMGSEWDKVTADSKNDRPLLENYTHCGS